MEESNAPFSLPSHVNIIVIEDANQCEEILTLFMKKIESQLKSIVACEGRYENLEDIEYLILGLDCEWKPSRKGDNKRVALLQLCNGKDCFLIRIFCFHKDERIKPFLPPILVSLLENPKILKCGVGIHGDASLLWTNFGVQVRGIVDLQLVAQKNGYIDSRNAGLKNLAESILKIDNVDKSYNIRCSNWENIILTKQQVKYPILYYLFFTY